MALNPSGDGGDLERVYRTLEAAVSPGAARRQAEQLLESWRGTPGFISVLLQIVLHRSDIEPHLRQAAMILVKNHVTSGWRKVISPQEKAELRANLLRLVEEPHHSIAKQAALTMASIARSDIPNGEWPGALETLTHALQRADVDVVVRLRALEYLCRIVHALASMTLRPQREMFKSISPALVSVARDVENTCVVPVLEALASSSSPLPLDEVIVRTRLASVAIKMQRPLIARGISDFSTIEDIFVSHVERLRAFATWRASVMGPHPPTHRSSSSSRAISADLMRWVDKCMAGIVSIMVATSAGNPRAFFPHLPMHMAVAMDVICWEGAFDDAGTPACAPRNAVIGLMRFLKGVMACKAYAPSSSGAGGDKEASAAANAALCRAMSSDVLVRLVRTLILRYFILSKDAITMWRDDPVEFAAMEREDSDEDSMRGCAERLYLQAMHRFSPMGGGMEGGVNLPMLVAELIKEVVNECEAALCSSSTEMEALQAAMAKDAAYAALGHASFDLHDHVHFPSLFESKLAAEASPAPPIIASMQQHNASSSSHATIGGAGGGAIPPHLVSSCALVRRRVAWLIGQWVMDVEDHMRPAAYRTLIECMRLGSAAATNGALGPPPPGGGGGGGVGCVRVRDRPTALAACASLHALVADFRFYPEPFLPVVEDALGAAFALAREARDSATQLLCLDVVTTLVKQLDKHILPYAGAAFEYISGLWADGVAQRHAMMQIGVLRGFTALMGSVGSAAGHALYDAMVPLIAAAIDRAQPLHLCCLEDGLDLWSAVLEHAPHSVAHIDALWPHVLDTLRHTFEHLVPALQIIDRMAKVCPHTAQHLSSLAGVLCGTLGNVLDVAVPPLANTCEALVTIYAASEECLRAMGPLYHRIAELVASGAESPMAVASYMRVYARLIVQNTAFFWNMMDGINAMSGGGNVIVGIVLDAWLDVMDFIGAAEHRRLSGVAMCLLLPSGRPDVLSRMGRIVDAISSTAADFEENYREDFLQGLMPGPGQTASALINTRTAMLMARDPINGVKNVAKCCMSQLQACLRVVGQDTFDSAMSRVDPHILATLQSQARGET